MKKLKRVGIQLPDCRRRKGQALALIEFYKRQQAFRKSSFYFLPFGFSGFPSQLIEAKSPGFTVGFGVDMADETIAP